MSAFGSKRKPRIIQTFDDDEDQASAGGADDQKQEDRSLQALAPVKFGRRPTKSSSLRKSINVNDDSSNDDGGAPISDAPAADQDDVGSPVVVRPAVARHASAKQKKKASSRLSFGPGEAGHDDAEQASRPTKMLGHKPVRSSALKKSLPLQNLPSHFLGADDVRPRYSKEYLDELQSSTPNTPQNLSSLRISDDDGDVEMGLDSSELEGATVVEQQDTSVAVRTAPGPAPTILTEAQIREKKERRARIALEADFMPLDEQSEDEGDVILLDRKKKKPEPRLVAEDEDLGEGYDEYVEDGRLSLGRRAEREARRRQRKEMAELIQEAEEGSSDEDDSETERRAAYDAAQRRAGLDGLHRPEDEDGGASVIPRMRPLPDLEDCLRRMRDMLQGLDDEVARKRTSVADMQREREEILQREKEVQDILDQAGAKYQALSGAVGASNAVTAATQSPLRPLPSGLPGEMPVERGLESFGTTPTASIDVENMG